MNATKHTQRATFALRGKVMVSKVREFSDELRAHRERRLSKAPPAVAGAARPLEHDDALAELDMQEAELSVAEEELRVQVSELERLAGRLAVEKDKFEELFALAPDPYFVTDRLGVIREANAAASTVLGVEPRHLRRKPLAIFIDHGHVGRMREAITRLEAGAAIAFEVMMTPRSGASVWVELRARVSRDGHRISWIARDVTSRRAKAETLTVTNAELEERVAERTEQLARALRDKEELLARERSLTEELTAANRAKDRFLAILSHDLRSPINAVLGWTTLLRRELLPITTRNRALATIERNARAQGELVDALLEVSRVAAGKMQLALRNVDLGELVRETVESAAPIAAERGIALVDETNGASPTVLADPARIRQVVWNLLSNALKFTGAGGTVRVALAVHDDEARLCVTDTGRGVPAAMLPRVFDLFRQGSQGSEPSQREGLGLGLYIVRQLIEMHGGRVVARSDGEGKGASFHITLPVRDFAPDSPRVSQVRESTRSFETDGRLDGIRVLVVDDDEDAREMVSMILDRAGAEVLSVGDGVAAVDACAAFAPDLLLSDVDLPGINGHELVHRLRSGNGGHLPAIAVTGFASPSDAKRAIEAGFDAHLGKPLAAGDLLEAVRTVLADDHR